MENGRFRSRIRRAGRGNGTACGHLGRLDKLRAGSDPEGPTRAAPAERGGSPIPIGGETGRLLAGMSARRRPSQVEVVSPPKPPCRPPA